MRFANPPLFINSPASMKNGIAINGKLSAPLMMFCATICESNIPIVLIKAMPQMISANAIGMPSAIAPSNEKVKTAIVMTLRAATSVLLRFPDRHQIGLARLPGNHPEQVVEQQDAG